MAMFAASILEYLTRAVEATVDDVLIGGPMVAAYVVGRLLHNPRVPPVGLAVVVGAVAIVVLGEVGTFEVDSALPQFEVVSLEFSLESIFAVTLPMVILVIGLGNIQALGFMISEGYRPPLNAITALIGGMTAVNALLGGHPAAMARTGTAVVAGREAGPIESRYWAALVAITPGIFVALGTGIVVALIQVLPAAYIYVMAGLAILAAFEDAIQKSFTGSLRLGAVIAFVVTLSTFTVAGIPAAFWALVAGVAASFVLERRELLRYWRQVVSRPHSAMDHVVESMEIRRWEEAADGA
jgi:benzoate membrane transport protein